MTQDDTGNPASPATSGEGLRESGEQQYYVCSQDDVHKGLMDGCILWWRAEGHGYTYDLNHAGMFTKADMDRKYPDPERSIYVPKELAEQCSFSPKLAWWSDAYKNPICKHLSRTNPAPRGGRATVKPSR